MADEAKVPIPPGVHPLFLTMSTQEKFACVEMKDCTSEKPYVYVTKKVFLDDIQFRGAISDFHPVKKQIEKYPDSEEEGLAIVWDENEDYGQNFYICLTVKAKDAVVEKYAALAEAAAAQGGETSGGTRGSFALAQLLHAAPLLDMSNEHGREALEGQLKRLLKSLATADDALAPAMRALSAACRAADGDGERAAFQRLVLELIGEVEDPLEAEVDEGIDAEEAAAAERRERERMEAQGKLAAVHAELADAQEIDDLEKVEELTAKAATMAASVAAMEAESAVGGEELHARTQRCLQLAECLMLQVRVAAVTSLTSHASLTSAHRPSPTPRRCRRATSP